MKLVSKLKESRESKDMNDAMEGVSHLFPPDRRPRIYKPLDVGDYTLSVQGSALHHCSPRLTLAKAGDYKNMEMALMDAEHTMIRVRDAVPHFSRLADIELHYNDPVYSHVPLDLLEALYNELKGT